MYLISFTFFFIAQSFHQASPVDPCDEIMCSHIYDPVCGVVKKPDNTRIVRVYQNICHLNKIQCKIKADSEHLERVPDEICHLNTEMKSLGKTRRIEDHSIVGAYQACNHTCPTFCVDTYEPVCAQIWRDGMQKYFFRPMVNHCHVDLISCTLAVNVTIQALGKCYKNPTGLMFLSQMAALKSMGLLNDAQDFVEPHTPVPFNKLKEKQKLNKNETFKPSKSSVFKAG